jgi:hypothetical protein
MEYIGTARNVRELLELLKKVNSSSGIELQGTDESWSYLEVWYDSAVDFVVLK